jgi:hypothetical protein
MLLERIRELSGLRWELWEAVGRGRRARADLGRARAERLRLQRRLGAAVDAPPPPAGAPARPLAEQAPELADLSVVLLCPDLGRHLDPALAVLRLAGVVAVSIAAARSGLFTEQRLLALARQGVRVHRAPRLGRAANQAVGGSTSPDVLVLRADVRPAAGALERGLAAAAGSDVTVLTTEPPSASPRAGLLLAGLAPAATLVRRARFDSLGGFDEAMDDGLDLELWLRADSRAARVTILERALEPGDGFFAGQAWGEPLERIVSRHSAALAGQDTLAALGHAAAEMQRRVEEARGLAERAEAELRGEREALARVGERLREAGRARFDLGELPRDGLVSHEWGAERGKPIDRYYIEAFLRRHEQDLRGRCLEIKEPAYTKWLGGERVTACDVLDIDASNRGASLHGDLARGAGIPDAQYDCFVLTQTLHLLYDVPGALFHALRVLRPGGRLLVTVPSVSRVIPGEDGIDTDYWRFTEASMRRLFAELLPLDAFTVGVYGNATAAAAFLYGLCAEDLEPGELERADPHFPVIVAVRARKPA